MADEDLAHAVTLINAHDAVSATRERARHYARRAIDAYAAALHVPAEPEAAGPARDDPARFYALALNADGSPVRVINSDAGFDLLFGSPDAARLGIEVEAMMRPFPAGLMTGIGLLVANPVHAPAATQRLFTPADFNASVLAFGSLLTEGFPVRRPIAGRRKAKRVSLDTRLRRILAEKSSLS